MKNVRPSKKKPEDAIDDASNGGLSLNADDWEDFGRGVRLFNEGKFWHAHEAWEEVWKRRAGDDRTFFQGLIQLAAAYHQLVSKGSYRGLLNNFEKAYGKLSMLPPDYLGVPVTPLVACIKKGKEEAGRLGEADIRQFDRKLIPKLVFRKPSNPDCAVELRDLVRSAEFREGVKLFNAGYYWEAHEAWEEAWRKLESDARLFAQAFVQMAAAYSFVKLGKLSSAKYLFEKSIEKFGQFEYETCAVRIAPLLEAMGTTLSAVVRSLADNSVPVRISGVPLIALLSE